MVSLMDDKVLPLISFEIRAVEDRDATIKKGHYVARDVEFCSITPPGGNLVHECEVNDEIRRTFERQYNAWKVGEEIPVDGTALRNWPPISPAQLQTCKAVHVLTVEQLAAADEATLGRIGMGARALKDKAAVWLKSANDHGKVSEEVAALKIEFEALKSKYLETKEENTILKAQVKAMENLQPKPKLGIKKPQKTESDEDISKILGAA